MKRVLAFIGLFAGPLLIAMVSGAIGLFLGALFAIEAK